MPDRGGPSPSGPRFRVGASSRRSRALLLTAAVLAVLAVLFVVFAGFWTDWLWYRSVRYTSVFTTRLWTKTGLFAVFGLLMALAVGFNIWLAHRLRPPLSAMSVEQQSLDRYRLGVAPYRRWLLLGISLIVGLIAGGSATGQWRTWLLWVNATPFGTTDPQFHKDISFYTFDLPWYRFLLNFGFSAAVVSLLAAALVHYLYGGLRLQGPGRRVSTAAQGHLAVLLGVFVAFKAVAYWLDRYGLALKSGSIRGSGAWAGLRYVDANAYLPAKSILFFVAVICAVLFFITPLRRTWSLPLIGFGLLVLSALLIGGLYPAIVQQFQVKPNEAKKEAPYIKKNIDATRAAYGIDGSTVEQYPAAATPDKDALAKDTGTLDNIRVLDPNIVSPTFTQLEQQRGYYSFAAPLDIDRYGSGDNVQDTVVGVRELNLSGVPTRNWVNDHFKYTHGYAVAAAKGDTVTQDGDPDFTLSGLPPKGDFPSADRWQVYFGEQTTTYSIVGGANKELDYYDSDHRKEVTTTYDGSGGVSLDSPLTRAAYAVKFSEPQLLYSGAITPGAKIMYDRTPKERVEAVAPWLSIDGDPYPVVVGGKVLWVVDGYTTSNGYPYSSRTTLGDVTADSLTGGNREVLTQANQVNYIRNSVKATVDAFTGEVTLYQWDAKDPVLKTWMKAFPGTVKPTSAIDPGLMQHLRYPQDLFKVQRDLLTRYHVTDPAAFYASSDVWKVPTDPTSSSGADQPPYYLTVRMPGESSAFSLTTSFVPNRRDNLAAFMAVNANPGPDYGKMRILTMPEKSGGGTIPGPKQVQAKFNSFPGIATDINLLKRGDSTLEYGNLLTLPVGNGLLYVEPVYVRGAGVNYPRLRKVLAVYGGSDNIAYTTTLSQALKQVLDVTAGPAQPTPTPTPAQGGGGTAPAPASPDVQKALQDAQKAFEAGQAALKAGDWAEYGKQQKALQDALAAAVKAQTPGTAPSGSPSATPSGSPSPTPSGTP
ncbi:UPF0182 family membrane protein [Peterkaempfera griseoplana]|uniref:UPF0182 family membrane protein n=1 Tax=Peterkaempfera griseoplana TaxID=66896 RepID=UPI00099EBA2D|nr:UPF0182 family protein [Peterkaempfera griseoplana]